MGLGGNRYFCPTLSGTKMENPKAGAESKTEDWNLLRLFSFHTHRGFKDWDSELVLSTAV